MASRLIRNQLPERVAGSTPVSSAIGTAVTGGAFFCRAGQAREESGITSQRDSIYFLNEIVIRSTIGFDLFSVESVRRIWI